MNGFRIFCLLPVLLASSVLACSSSEPTTGSTTTGGAGGNGAGGGTVGSGGAGGAPCTDPATQCAAPETVCATAICEAGACATQPAPAGTACGEGGGQVCDGSGDCVACTDAATHCPAPPNECVLATCADGACGLTNVAEGTPTSAGQLPGDCKQQVCDGAGSTEVVDDDADPQDDLNDCTADACSGGAGVHPAIAGACDDNGGAVCADPLGPKAGQCVQCNVDADCAAPAVCDPKNGSNTCVAPECTDGAENGTETDVDCGGSCSPCADAKGCAAAADCQSGFCDAGVCSPCGADADCPATSFCDLAAPNGGTCSTDKGEGAVCTLDSQCASGSCADGFCCNTACSGLCEACSASLKGQGVDGICGPVAAGSDPSVECAQSPASSCQQTGACDGAGACQLYAAGVICGAPACAGGQQQNVDLCDGTGTCVDGGVTGCGAFACNAGGTACLTICGSDADCASGNYCNAGACTPTLTNGAACSGDNQCSSGSCADGVCCNSACGALCQACNLAGSVGTCANVPSGTDPAGECAGNCNGAGACANSITKWSEGTMAWPDQACNPTNSFGSCNTNAQNHADAWATAVCQQNGYASGVWTGNKAPGCNGAISMWCQGQIPCSKLFETSCAPSDQTKVEVTCFF